MHAGGAKAGIQIAHAGRKASPPPASWCRTMVVPWADELKVDIDYVPAQYHRAWRTRR
ncbi:MAG TPA: hypothetical protein H9821_07420 [Candidatus Rothia avicola]|uniref:NADH:flavin oxidoreductase/NADH oxidase N-terminal domain-containing protein n=1 Tax=Candidatus Rothia avicola TaxID=2840478 RepID=A0A9D2CPW6_9MICC|nr:hypothetical protein [Candidatus Rothia avicola]